MYTEIIVPLDGGDFSARALPVARSLADAMNAPVRLVGFALTAAHASDLRAAIGELARTNADGALSWRVERVDDIASAIATELADAPGALLCMASVGRPRAAAVLGSVAEGVLSKEFGPALLVGPKAHSGGFDVAGSMLVCSDGSSTSSSVLPIAAQWAITLPLEPSVITITADGPESGDLTDATPAARHAAEQLEADIGRPVKHETIRAKHPAAAIVERAVAMNAAVIAMSTHGETGLKRLALGSVAMGVVHAAPCPVLVHRPPHLAVEG